MIIQNGLHNSPINKYLQSCGRTDRIGCPGCVGSDQACKQYSVVIMEQVVIIILITIIFIPLK